MFNMTAISIGIFGGCIIFKIADKVKEIKRRKESERMNKLWRESKNYYDYLDKLGISH